jgi:hypothetical protein
MSNWFSNLLFGKEKGPSATEQAYTGATARQGAGARSAEDSYLSADAEFDPRQALNEYARGASADFSRQLGDELGKLRDSSAGGGRLNSGFFDEDQGQVVTELGSRFQADLNRHALDTAGMRQRQIEGRGAYAQNANQDYHDMLAGQLDRETARENARRQQRGAVIGGIAKVAGAAAGSVFGPVGAAAGAKLAGSVAR